MADKQPVITKQFSLADPALGELANEVHQTPRIAAPGLVLAAMSLAVPANATTADASSTKGEDGQVGIWCGSRPREQERSRL
jgi:hypothetical protein